MENFDYFNKNVSIEELFDSIHYLNKMAKIIEPDKRLISNSLFYKLKSEIIKDLIFYSEFYELNIEILSIDKKNIDERQQDFLKILIKDIDDKYHLEVHQELNEELINLINSCFKNINLDLIPKLNYEKNLNNIPDFNKTKYAESYNNLISYVRNSGIFFDMLYKYNWDFRLKIKYLSYFYPEIKIITTKKVRGNNSIDSKIIADVFIYDKKSEFSCLELKTIFNKKTIIKILNKIKY